MVKAELGTKRTCPSCAARFYDLLKDPVVCPKCGVTFMPAAILPSKSEIPGAAPQPVKAPKPVVVEAEPADVELVSLEEAEAPDTPDDETAGIEDVDLGEEAETTEGEEDDTFLVEEEEENDNMTSLIDGGPAGGKEEEEEP